ncbi:hypothetical protein RIR_jg28942.t1 [Rhizophagus irregularis DAOM 181602=DAOM 197198]|nr:hypothetical protein RIR_jg28942.t1 [Rhizophagus irregularis DAOM 181602=DAOM 197198]
MLTHPQHNFVSINFHLPGSGSEVNAVLSKFSDNLRTICALLRLFQLKEQQIPSLTQKEIRYKLIKGPQISCSRGKPLGDTYQWWRALAVARECGSRVVFYQSVLNGIYLSSLILGELLCSIEL